MEYMFTNPSFFANPNQPVRQWLYLFTHCILKSRNEAVVEGMGCVLDNHAAPGRHLQMEQFTAEAMIHWNGPAAHQCENFLTLALNDYFGPTAWNFHRTYGQPKVTSRCTHRGKCCTGILLVRSTRASSHGGTSRTIASSVRVRLSVQYHSESYAL